MRLLLRSITLVVVLCCWQVLAMAQYQLVLEKPGAFKRQRIFPGDEIGLRVKGMDQIYVGELEGVRAGKLYIFGDSLVPDSLDRIRLARSRYWPNMVRTSLIMVAVLYPVMMVINLPAQQWSWERAGQVAAVSAAALILQRPMKFFYWKRIRLDKGRWRLRIMPTAESL
jgi:hypothetical protein